MEMENNRERKNEGSGSPQEKGNPENKTPSPVKYDEWEDVNNYVPIGQEVVLLVKHWYRWILDEDWFRFICGESRRYSRWHFAWKRISQACAAIGDEAVDKAIEEVRQEVRNQMSARLWDLFENGTMEQWDAVAKETWRGVNMEHAEKVLTLLEQLQKRFQGDFIALVLSARLDGKEQTVLFCPADSELNSVLQASGKFGIERDASKIKPLMVDQEFSSMGFIQGTRQGDGDWRFEFPESQPGSVGWVFLEVVVGKIQDLLHARAAAIENREEAGAV